MLFLSCLALLNFVKTERGSVPTKTTRRIDLVSAFVCFLFTFAVVVLFALLVNPLDLLYTVIPGSSCLLITVVHTVPVVLLAACTRVCTQCCARKDGYCHNRRNRSSYRLHFLTLHFAVYFVDYSPVIIKQR